MSDLMISVPERELEEFCRRNHIRKLSFFGSVLRESFTADSDEDVLVEFESGHVPGLELIHIQEESSTLLREKKWT